MCPDMLILGYIDPNTSQHVFSLLGPILAVLGTAGGLIATALVFVRHRIASYFRKASWSRRIAAVCLVLGGSATIAAGVWWLIR